ncbi:hypothetical protein D9M68_667760 [compost metagenome]
MADNPLFLFFTMTEKFSDHLTATGAYPEKFVLNLAQHDTYLRDVALFNAGRQRPLDPALHMGIRIEIDAASPGVMVASDGTQVLLLG